MDKWNQKSGIGKSGVHLRYHKPEECNEISKAQRKEPRDWRIESNISGKTSNLSLQKSSKKQREEMILQQQWKSKSFSSLQKSESIMMTAVIHLAMAPRPT